MNKTAERSLWNKDLRILWASSLLLVLVYSKDYSWAWFGNTMFWITAFTLILFSILLIGWLLVEINAWVKDGFKKKHLFLIYLSTIGIIAFSIYGMR